MNIPSAKRMAVLCLGLFFACAAPVLSQPAIELMSGDIDRVEIKGLPPTKTQQRALISFHVSDSARNRARAAGQSLPENLSASIEGKAVDLKLSADQSLYSAEIGAPRRLPLDKPTSFAHRDSGAVKGTGPAGNPNFEIEFEPCAANCKSVIFRTKCIVCIKKISW